MLFSPGLPLRRGGNPDLQVYLGEPTYPATRTAARKTRKQAERSAEEVLLLAVQVDPSPYAWRKPAQGSLGNVVVRPQCPRQTLKFEKGGAIL